MDGVFRSGEWWSRIGRREGVPLRHVRRYLNQQGGVRPGRFGGPRESRGRWGCAWVPVPSASALAAAATLGWWQVFDHHLTLLTSTGGPFAQCTHTGHRSDGQPLTMVPALPGTWAEE